MGSRAARFFSISVASFALACGGVQAANVEAPPPPPKPKDADAIAKSIVAGKVSSTVWVDRMRGRPIEAKLRELDLWGPYLAGTGVDPMTDFDRVFFTAPAARRPEQTITVLEHHMPPEKVKSAIEVLIGRSDPPGGWISSAPAEARVTIRGYTRVIAVVNDAILAVVPEPFAPKIDELARTGGLPDPVGSESVLSTAIDPSVTLAGARIPPIPATIASTTTKISMGEDGSMDVAIDGDDANEAAASDDAQTLTRELDDATSVKVAIVKIRLLEPIVFRAEGNEVKTNIHLAPADVDKLLGFAAALRPR